MVWFPLTCVSSCHNLCTRCCYCLALCPPPLQMNFSEALNLGLTGPRASSCTAALVLIWVISPWIIKKKTHAYTFL